ncbi:MAG: sialate O-acetylesterase [Planctomycetota bacterium]
MRPNSSKYPSIPRVVILCVFFCSQCAAVVASPPKQPLHVYLLAGQSNMEGQGVVDLDHPQYYNGGRGILKNVMKEPGNLKRYKHIQDANGKWVIRDDVWCRFQTKNELKAGALTIGFAGYPGKHHIGPEFQFGHVLGDATAAPVLLIKTAWGGKSLYADFRPPGSGGTVGPYYKKMIEEVRAALAALGNRKYRISGFVWFQGWNDMVNKDARAEYTVNMVNLAADIRKEFKLPRLPVVIGELGNMGEKAGGGMAELRKAQASAASSPKLGKGTVAFVKTTPFARPKELSPNTGHGHHWFGNAESYFLIGDALGKAMVKLLETAKTN